MHNGVISDFVTISRDLVDLMDDDAYGNISGSVRHFSTMIFKTLGHDFDS